MIKSFDPVVGGNPKVLILGSVPSVKSLDFNQYYGHPRNQFWPIIMSLLLDKSIDDNMSMTYSDKIEIVKLKGIAIWDVISACDRQGSLDSDIKNESPNDISKLLQDYPSIRTIVFNGGKAETSFKRFFKEIYLNEQYVCLKMPSTSPAYTKSVDEKWSTWKVLLKYI